MALAKSMSRPTKACTGLANRSIIPLQYTPHPPSNIAQSSAWMCKPATYPLSFSTPETILFVMQIK